MDIAIDHIFIASRPDAPQADALLERGFLEGSANVHPGQGTANRRFFFVDFMLEFIWVRDQAEATSERTRRYFQSSQPLLALQFEGAEEHRLDLQPALPLILHCAP